MRLLDRYVSKELFSTFVTCIITFSILYLIIDTFSMLEDLRKSVDFKILLQYYLTLLPSIFSNTAPFAMLLSTLYALGKLNHNNEIIAMRASGLSIFRIVSPILIISLVVTCLLFLVNEKLLPKFNKMNKEIRTLNLMNKEDASGNEIIENIALISSNNRLIYIEKFDKKNFVIEDINILDQDQYQNITSKIIANKGHWIEDTKWKLYQVIIHEFDTPAINQSRFEPKYRENMTFDLKLKPVDLLKRKVNVENMNLKELNDYIKKIEQTNAKPVLRNLRVDFQQKISFPFTAFIITLIGIPFGFTSRRRGTAIASLGVCFLISLIYYAVNAIGIALGKGGILYPVIAAWIAHIVFAAFGLSLLSLLP